MPIVKSGGKVKKFKVKKYGAVAAWQKKRAFRTARAQGEDYSYASEHASTLKGVKKRGGFAEYKRKKRARR